MELGLGGLGTQLVLDETGTQKEQLYQAALGRDWKKVLELYTEHPEIHSTRITVSEDTALHVAITQGAPEETVTQLVKAIITTPQIENANRTLLEAPDDQNTITEALDQGANAKKTLGVRNKRGDTPLHFAASRGSSSICSAIIGAAEKCDRLLRDVLELLQKHNEDEWTQKRGELEDVRESLVRKRNVEGETPLFVAALSGNKDAFYYLYSVSRDGQSDTSLWRKQGGDTILHCTIQRQYFDLSLQIIHLYKDQKMATFKNGEGVTPLHHLASIPTAFLSGTRLRWRDKLLYKYVHVEPLKFDHVELDIDNSAKYVRSADDAPAKRYPARGSLRKIKEKHIWGRQIMEELLKQNSEYAFNDSEISPFLDLSELEDLQLFTLARSEEKTETDTKRKKEEEEEEEEEEEKTTSSALIKATGYGLKELVEGILEKIPVAIHDKGPNNRNIVLVAAERRQPHILRLLMKNPLWHSLVEAVDDLGNNALHWAAFLPEHMPWEVQGSAMQMQWEVKWFEHVKEITPPYLSSQRNKKGKTPEEIFAKKHKALVKDAKNWLKDTSSSYSIVAALTAGVTYSTSYSVPGGTEDDSGKPILQSHPAFKLFSISALISFCLSITSLAAFLGIYSSRMQPRDFRKSLPLKLLLGLSSFFVSVVTMLVSFCAAHSFELEDYRKKDKVNPWYAIALLPLCFYAVAQIPLYWDLLKASFTEVPKPNKVGEDVPI